MLQPILDPFHRTSNLARGEAHRDDVREDGLFDAEAPTGIPRAAQPQPRAGNPQRPRHHRMQRERTLEVGQHVIAVVPEVFGHDDEPLDRGARIARIAHRDRHPVRGARECSVGVAVAEAPVAHDVRADFAVQQRCAGRRRGGRIDHRVELAVLDLDPFERVFGPIAVARHHHRHRLPHVTHPIDRKCVMPHRLLHPGDERPGPRGDLRAGQDGDDLGHRERGGRVEGDDLGMCMRRAQHRGVGGAGPLPHVVGEAPAPGEQCRVLHAFHRASDETGKGARGVRGGLACDRRFRGRLGRWSQETGRETAQGTTDPRSFVPRPARHTRSLTRIGRLFFLFVPRTPLPLHRPPGALE